MHRVFLALWPPPELAEPLAAAGRGLDRARPIEPAAIHLTVRFLGRVPVGLRALARALDDLVQPSFELELAGAGVFPARGPPSVLWVGVRPSPALSSLRQAVDRALEPLGLAPDPRRFVPHVTVARCGDPGRGASRRGAPARRLQLERALAARIAELSLTRWPPFPADALAVVASALGPAGPRYVTLLERPLGPPPPRPAPR